MENEIIGQFISTLFSSRTQAHVFHLQTDSFAEHSALNVYYDEIVGITDGIVESYQGKYGIIRGYGNVALQEFQNCEGVIAYFEMLYTYVEKSRQMLPQYTYIQNQIDEVAALITSTLYKLRFLK